MTPGRPSFRPNTRERRKTTAPIQDVASLPGKKVTDQDGRSIGAVREIYAAEGSGEASWLSIEDSSGLGDDRTVFIPLARLKEEDGELRSAPPRPGTGARRT